MPTARTKQTVTADNANAASTDATVAVAPAKNSGSRLTHILLLR